MTFAAAIIALHAALAAVLVTTLAGSNTRSRNGR